MALFRPSSIVQSISGNVGGVTFVQGQRGNVVRHRPLRINRITEERTDARTRWAFIYSYWYDTLSASQRLEWETTAVTITRTNRLGIPHRLTGLELFLIQNVKRPTIDPPRTSPGPCKPGCIMGGVTFTCKQGGPFTFALTSETNTDGNIRIWFARPFTDRPINSSPHWKYAVGTTPTPVVASSKNYYGNFINTWGVPALGERIGIRFFRHGAFAYIPSPTQTLWTFVVA